MPYLCCGKYIAVIKIIINIKTQRLFMVKSYMDFLTVEYTLAYIWLSPTMD